MKFEIYRPVHSMVRSLNGRRKKTLYAVCMAVDYPGEFELYGKRWRVVTGQVATSAVEAFFAFDSMVGKIPSLDYIATTYAPALDVLKTRQYSVKS